MTGLYIAAGGGGDAIAASIISRVNGDQRPETIIATYAWDRLRTDPLPGPRAASDFDGLEPLGEFNFLITGRTAPKAPSGSTLPQLGEELTERLVLLDPTNGAEGMRRQIAELVEITGTTTVYLVDVGGDILTNGTDANLKSPLADSLAAAACVGLPVPVDVRVIGPGLDGELSLDDLSDRLPSEPEQKVELEHVAHAFGILEWHPSEATALLVAAAKGARGAVELRDQGYPTILSEESVAVYALELRNIFAVNKLATRLVTTNSLSEVETLTRQVCGFSEIDYERRKAAKLAGIQPTESVSPAQAEQIAKFIADATKRQTAYTTSRRIAEATHPPASVEAVREYLREREPNRFDPPLWSILAAADLATAD